MKPQCTFIGLIFCLIAFPLYSKIQIDTLVFYSPSFQTQREVYVIEPDQIKYYPEKSKMPRFYLLDGQHEWFVQPIINQIEYLWYTHQIPLSRIIVIPHKDRNEESIFTKMSDTLPLHHFIEYELEKQLENYPDNGLRILIGHSFTASFAIHAGLRSPFFFNQVVAHSPLNMIEDLMSAIHKTSGNTNYYLSFGGIDPSKDSFHRQAFEKAKSSYDDLTKNLHIYIEESGSHNSVPIISTARILSEMFVDFSKRYHFVPEVDMEYKLIHLPGTADEELNKLKRASVLLGKPYAPEIPEVNGIASKYYNNGFSEQALAIYLEGHTLYPNYFEFPAYAGELMLSKSKEKACELLKTALALLDTYEQKEPDYEELRNELLSIVENCP